MGLQRYRNVLEAGMKRLTLIVVAMACMAGVGLVAQTRGGAAQPVTDAMRSSWDGAKKNIRETADVVPESLYSFSPVPGTVRTLGEILGHVAGANYEICSAAKGEKSPHPESAF